MSEKSNNSLGIILLVVGLVVGAGGGYFFAQSKAQPLIAEYVELETSLLEDIQDAEDILGGLTEDVDDVETEIDGLDNSLLDNQIEVNTNQNEIDSVEHSIDVFSDKIVELEARTTTLSGYEIFSIYDLWFQHPAGMRFSFEEVGENQFSGENGIVAGTLERGSRDETLQYVWQYVDFVPDVENDLDGRVEDYVNAMQELDIDTSVGEKIVSEVDGHTMYTQTVTVSYRGDEVGRATYATWYCNINSLAYRGFYFNAKPGVDDRYENSLLTTYCH